MNRESLSKSQKSGLKMADIYEAHQDLNYLISNEIPSSSFKLTAKISENVEKLEQSSFNMNSRLGNNYLSMFFIELINKKC